MAQPFRVEIVYDNEYEVVATAPDEETARLLRDYYESDTEDHPAFISVRIVRVPLTPTPDPE
jgi:hypothetical protein